jgi:two-component system response regulator HydG
LVSKRPIVTIVILSESFSALWQDMAAELDVELVTAEPDQPLQGDSVAVIVAAGGEEGRGLDALITYVAESRPTYLVGTNTSHRFGIEATRRGAADYFALPNDLDLFRRTLASQVEMARESMAAAPGVERGVFDRMIGNSPALRETLDRAARIIPHGDVTVLIQGETGTGKEVLAKAIHDGGPRASSPFVAINCAAIPGTLLESELFGHEKGAFTDAHVAKAGLFEEANHGTLFLDEIGHLPLPLQGKLLRAIEERQIRRVGSNETRKIDARVVTATHVDLREAVAAGEFREDLYYRLNVVTLRLPPLRDRGDDLELLAHRFAQDLAARYGLATPSLTGPFLTALRAHSWPGNVRELRHAIERALLLSDPGKLDPAELAVSETAHAPISGAPIPFPASLREITAAIAKATLRASGGNKSAAARQLDISRARLQRLMDGEEDDG